MHLDLPPFDAGAPVTLGGLVAELADRFGELEALVHYDALRAGERATWSYRRLQHEARQIAKALTAAGIGKGERVGLLLGNRNEFAAALFGSALIGALPVTLSTLSTADELRVLLEQSQISLLLTQARIANRSLSDDLACLMPKLDGGRLLDPALPHLRRIVALCADDDNRVEDWHRFLAEGAAISDAMLDARAAAVTGDDLGVIIYTSGTTSMPKGVVHYHSTLVAQFRWQVHIYGREPGIRVGSPFPLFWSAGLVSVLGSTLAAGGTYVGQEVFEPGATLRLIARERIEEWYGFPTHTAALAAHPDWLDADLSSLSRVKGSYEFDGHPNTSPSPHWHHVVATAYGMSECCTLLTSHLSTTPLEIARLDAGLPLPGVELRIASLEHGGEVAPGDEGEICARGSILMAHYAGMRREASFDPDGYFHTGDLGFLDADGHLHWTGRIKDMIKTAGANVAPGEIEEAAAAIGSLKLCRAIGIPDKRLGEMIVLCAVRQDGADICEASITTALRGKLASYKVPRRVLFFAIEDYPLTASGKVRDKELQQLARARL
jgi:acyl-CoA synthetase (AMP-forming)/AMP-acid ligase II